MNSAAVKKMKHLILLLLTFSFLNSFSQLDTTVAKNDSSLTDSNAVVLANDTNIADSIKVGSTKLSISSEADSLILFQRASNKENCPKLVRGYKVQVYSCAGQNCQEKADKTYKQFLIAFPDIPAEVVWEAPSYKVRVGNCRNRFEAEGIKARIQEDFPFIFLVPDYITSPVRIKCDDMK